jgi:hypothetical protein
LKEGPYEAVVIDFGLCFGSSDRAVEAYCPQPGNIGANTMAKSYAKGIFRRAKLIMAAWQQFLLLSMFVSLFGAAIAANISDSSMTYMKGAWATQAMR